MSRYLVIETAYLGDVIISLAVAHAIKLAEPNSRITYLVRPDAAAIAGASPDVDDVVIFDKRGADRGRQGIEKKAGELNRMGFDIAIALHSSERTLRLVSRLEASRKIGFAGKMSTALHDTVPDHGWHDRYERVVRVLMPLFGDRLELLVLPRIRPTRLAEVDTFVEGAPMIVTLAPGSAWETKKWPAEHFAQLAQRLMSDGTRVIVIGGSAEREAAEQITVAGNGVLNLVGRASLLESAYAVSMSDLLIGNDSSPTHLAVAVGTPALTLFGPTVPEFGFGPPEGRGESIGIDLWCRPCTRHGSQECPVHTHACMNELSAQAVYEKALVMLSRLRTATGTESF